MSVSSSKFFREAAFLDVCIIFLIVLFLVTVFTHPMFGVSRFVGGLFQRIGVHVSGLAVSLCSVVSAKANSVSFESESADQDADKLMEDEVRCPVGVHAIRGRRDYMEDVVAVVPKILSDDSLFCGVFDGHGGGRASDFLGRELAPCLDREFRRRGVDRLSSKEDITNTMSHVVQRLDEKFCSLANAKKWTDGSTATFAILTPDDCLYVSHTGDSRGVICNTKRGATTLTVDHKPDRPDEMHRIQSSGGFVNLEFGTWRVNGILAMSRAFGDSMLKPSGVVSDPDLIHKKLSPEDEYLVLATDGLFDVMNATDVFREVQASVRTHGRNMTVVAQHIVRKAYFLGSYDNISVLVVDLVAYRKMHEENAKSSSGEGTVAIECASCCSSADPEHALDTTDSSS
jgi:protein phosphatase 1L